MCDRFVVGGFFGLLAVSTSSAQTPLGTAITYQGQLHTGGGPVDATADFQFSLWDAIGVGSPPMGGAQIGSTQSFLNVNVVGGLFTVAINGSGEFGPAAFNGEARWLQIAVRSPAGVGSYTALSPRQTLTATPQGLYAKNAGTLDGLDSTAFPLLAASQGWTGVNTFSNASNSFTGSGLGLTNLNATNLANGTVPATRLSGSYTGVTGVGTLTAGTWQGTPIAPTYGGLGLNTAGTPTGSLLRTSAVGTWSTLPPGANGQVLTLSGGAPAWVSATTVPILPFSGVISAATNAFEISNTGSGPAIRGNGTSGQGLYGTTATGNNAVYGERTATGNKGWLGGVIDGVHGEATLGNGVYGLTTSSGSAGVFGDTSVVNGQGVLGRNLAATGTTFGVEGIAASDAGRGVFGLATSSTGTTFGVFGVNSSATGYGVYGSAQNATGINYGVYGRTSSLLGYGVYCEGPFRASGQARFDSAIDAQSVGAVSVFAESFHGDGSDITHLNAANIEGGPLSLTATAPGNCMIEGGNSSTVNGSCGVVGWGGNEGRTYGVMGISSSLEGQSAGVLGDGPMIGVYGRSSSAGVLGIGDYVGVYGDSNRVGGLGMYSQGDMEVNGTLSKSGGAFKIDHPLDPENYYLQHSFVESPDMMNVYNGNIVTDARSEAWVELPSYFETVNKDFRYQLTVIGQFAQAIIGEKIRENRFLILTDKPKVEVSWQVSGIRQDPWAEQNRIVPELAKREDHRGKFLNPELYGRPQEKGIHHRPHAATETDESPSPPR